MKSARSSSLEKKMLEEDNLDAKSTGSQSSSSRRKLRRLQSAYHDEHGGWSCKNCGYRYPVLHPSAHERRKHKKICPKRSWGLEAGPEGSGYLYKGLSLTKSEEEVSLRTGKHDLMDTDHHEGQGEGKLEESVRTGDDEGTVAATGDDKASANIELKEEKVSEREGMQEDSKRAADGGLMQAPSDEPAENEKLEVLGERELDPAHNPEEDNQHGGSHKTEEELDPVHNPEEDNNQHGGFPQTEGEFDPVHNPEEDNHHGGLPQTDGKLYSVLNPEEDNQHGGSPQTETELNPVLNQHGGCPETEGEPDPVHNPGEDNQHGGSPQTDGELDPVGNPEGGNQHGGCPQTEGEPEPVHSPGEDNQHGGSPQTDRELDPVGNPEGGNQHGGFPQTEILEEAEFDKDSNSSSDGEHETDQFPSDHTGFERGGPPQTESLGEVEQEKDSQALSTAGVRETGNFSTDDTGFERGGSPKTESSDKVELEKDSRASSTAGVRETDHFPSDDTGFERGGSPKTESLDKVELENDSRASSTAGDHETDHFPSDDTGFDSSEIGGAFKEEDSLQSDDDMPEESSPVGRVNYMDMETEYEASQELGPRRHIISGGGSGFLGEIIEGSEPGGRVVHVASIESGRRFTSGLPSDIMPSAKSGNTGSPSLGSLHSKEVGEITIEADLDLRDESTAHVVVEYDVERMLKEQTTLHLICPVCGSKITNRIVLRKKRRTFVSKGDVSLPEVSDITEGSIQEEKNKGLVALSTGSKDQTWAQKFFDYLPLFNHRGS